MIDSGAPIGTWWFRSVGGTSKKTNKTNKQTITGKKVALFISEGFISLTVRGEGEAAAIFV